MDTKAFRMSTFAPRPSFSFERVWVPDSVAFRAASGMTNCEAERTSSNFGAGANFFPYRRIFPQR